MAAPGWYLDPSGQPGRYRYWDGSSWSAETTDDPSRLSAGREPADADHRKRRRLVLLVVVPIVLVAVLIATIGVLIRREVVRADNRWPVSTASEWNDSSPTATAPTSAGAKPSAAGPMPSPTGNSRPDGTGLPPPTARPQHISKSECPNGRDSWSSQPDPTRIRGGDLSIPRLGPPWHAVIDNQYALGWGWARDIGGLSETIDYGDNANLFLGAVRPVAKHPYETAKQAASRLTSCVVQSYLDQHLVVTGIRHLQSQSVTVDGHHGWLIRTQSAIDGLQHDSLGLLADIVVIDTGKRLSFFYGEIPYPDARRIQIMDATVEALRVE